MTVPEVLSIKKPRKLKTVKQINGLWYADLEIEQDDYIAPGNYVEFDGELYITGKLKKILANGKTTYKGRLNHLMDELNDFTIEAFDYENVTAETALTSLLADTTWSVGTVDALGTESFSNDKRATVLYGIVLLISTFGGELYFNSSDRTVDIKSEIGTETKLQIRYGKNSNFIEVEEDPSKLVTRLYPYGADNITINTQIMENCDKPALWETTDEENYIKTPESTIKKQGSASIKIVATQTGSLNDIMDIDLGAATLDLTDHDLIKFWIRASRTGTNLQFGMGESAWNDDTHNINILVADKWQEEEWDISGIANADKDAIRYMGLKCTNADALNTIYIDYIRAFDGDIFLESSHLSDYTNPKESALFTTIEDPDELKAYGQTYLDLYDTPIKKYSTNTADLTSLSTYANETISLGDTLRLYNKDLDLNEDVRVKKIEKNLLVPTDMQLSLTNSVENIADNLADYYRQLAEAMPYDDDRTAINAGAVKVGYLLASVIRSNFIFANHYSQLRNVWQMNWMDSLDSSYPLECEFFIPKNVDEIKSCWVHIEGRNFRAYAKGAASGGGSTSGSGGGQTSSGGTSHSHSVSGQTAQNSGTHYHNISGFSTGQENSHTHSINLTYNHDTGYTSHTGIGDDSFESHKHLYNRRNSTTNSGSAHSHTIASHTSDYDNISGHTHSITGTTSSSESSHTHTVSNHTHTVPNHTHSLTFGIYEDTDPTGVNIYIDNGSGYGSSLASDNTPVSIDVDVASSLTTESGWKKLKITSTRLGRVAVAMIMDLTLSSV